MRYERARFFVPVFVSAAIRLAVALRQRCRQVNFGARPIRLERHPRRWRHAWLALVGKLSLPKLAELRDSLRSDKGKEEEPAIKVTQITK